MKKKNHWLAAGCMIVLVCVIAILGANGTIAKTLTRSAERYVLNEISVYAGGTLQKTIPASAFSASVSITSKTSDDTVYVVLAAYDGAGALLTARTAGKVIPASQTVSCSFEFANSTGNISSLRAYVLDSAANVLPVAGSIGVSNQTVVERAYFEGDTLILSLSDGTQKRVSLGTAETFADYDVGTVFPIEPSGEFDWPVIVNGKEYTVRVESMYYELTGKNDISDTSSYLYSSWEAAYVYQPYEVMVYIDAETDPVLACSEIEFIFYSSAGSYTFSGVIGEDGSIHIEWPQYTTEDPLGKASPTAWIAPKNLMFKKMIVTYRCKTHTFEYLDGYEHVCGVCGLDVSHTMVDGYCGVCDTYCKHRWNRTSEVHFCQYCDIRGQHIDLDEDGICDICNKIIA